MDAQPLPPSNFAFLQANNPQLMRLGMLAEQYFPADPNTSLLKQRQFAELLTQSLAANVGLASLPNENQYNLLRELQDRGILPRDVGDLLHEVRKAGNDANHALAGDHSAALIIPEDVFQHTDR